MIIDTVGMLVMSFRDSSPLVVGTTRLVLIVSPREPKKEKARERCRPHGRRDGCHFQPRPVSRDTMGWMTGLIWPSAQRMFDVLQ